MEIDINKVVKTLSEMAAPDTSGLADALDRIGTSEPAAAVQLTPSMVQGALQIVQQVSAGELPYEAGLNTLVTLFGISEDAARSLLGGGNGRKPGSDLSALLAVMNEGARQEPKGNGDKHAIEMRITHLHDERAMEEASMLKFYEMMREYESRINGLLAQMEDSRRSDEIRRVLESIRLAQAEAMALFQSGPSRASEAQSPVTVQIQPNEEVLSRAFQTMPAPVVNVPAPVVNVEMPVGDLVEALKRVAESGRSGNTQIAQMIDLLGRIQEAAQSSDVQPIINITVPEQPPPVVLNTINVPPQPAPNVTVEIPEQKPVTKRVIRDRQGNITEIKEEPEG